MGSLVQANTNNVPPARGFFPNPLPAVTAIAGAESVTAFSWLPLRWNWLSKVISYQRSVIGYICAFWISASQYQHVSPFLIS